MSAYLAKIGLGALGIFGLGMAGVTAAKKGVAELKSVATGPVREALTQSPANLLTFRLDGRRVGQIRSIDVAKAGEWDGKSVTMVVAVADGREPADLASCNLAADDYGHRREGSFRCLSDSDVADQGLSQIGEIRFEPGNVSRPLYVERRQLRSLRRTDIRQLKANVESADGRNVTGNAEYDITTDHGNREKGTVSLNAGEGKALIEIRGEDGKELFRLSADDKGLSINATDKRGSGLVRLLAGETGLKIDVKN